MNAKEVADYLGVSVTTVSNYIRDGIIVPENLESRQYDGEYRISEEHVAEVKEKLYPGGLTVSETVKYIGGECKPYHIHAAIKRGDLTAKESNLTNRKTIYVQQDIKLEDFKRSFIIKEKQKPYFDSTKQIYLFQSYRDQQGQLARVISVDKNRGYALTAYGDEVPLDHVRTSYRPQFSYKIGKAMNRVGEITFKFVKPTHVESPTYTFIEIVIQQVGLRNLSIEEVEQSIVLKTKPFVFVKEGLDDTTFKELSDLAKRSIVSGEFIERNNDTVFKSNEKKIEIVLPEELHKKLIGEAKMNNMTVQEFVQKRFVELLEE